MKTYARTAQTDTLIREAFMYHAPKDDQPNRYEAIRAAARNFAEVIATYCPPSPEQTLAIRDVQRACMMANACIACNE